MKKKLLGGAIALALGVGVMTVATPPPPAEAAPSGAFEIFYGPNCGWGGTASRVYTTSLNSTSLGEPWINDKFNLNRFGSKGYGTKIKNNAASVWIERGRLLIWFSYYGTPIGDVIGKGTSYSEQTCVNFADLMQYRSWTGRNHNTHFSFLSY